MRQGNERAAGKPARKEGVLACNLASLDDVLSQVMVKKLELIQNMVYPDARHAASQQGRAKSQNDEQLPVQYSIEGSQSRPTMSVVDALMTPKRV